MVLKKIVKGFDHKSARRFWSCCLNHSGKYLLSQSQETPDEIISGPMFLRAEMFEIVKTLLVLCRRPKNELDIFYS